MEQPFDLVAYGKRFDEVVARRYHRTFGVGFRAVDARFAEVRSGARLLTVDDVMAIFSDDLPYVRDWTKPDRVELARKMDAGARPAAAIVDEIGNSNYSRDLVAELVGSLRELTLAALVLHHVYPDRFAMCSHHLASQLHVTGDTVPEFYLEYCKELKAWAEHPWPTPGPLTVVGAEFALWTWYRLAFVDEPLVRQHQNEFDRDPWVQRRRATRIGRSLGTVDPLDLAVAFVETKPTVAAFVAYRELELAIRARTAGRVRPEPGNRHTAFGAHIAALGPGEIPAGVSRKRLGELREERNNVAHQNVTLKSKEALAIVDEITPLVRYFGERGGSTTV